MKPTDPVMADPGTASLPDSWTILSRGTPADEVVAAVERRAEVVQFKRCRYCGAKWTSLAVCCGAWEEEFQRWEAAFWGPPVSDPAGIAFWVECAEPAGDEPVVVEGES